jgi:tripartite-type tricarboxylate transporter receptor subunit TctC
MLVFSGLALAIAHANAQSYPTKPVRVIVPFPPGSGVDIVTRLVTPKLADGLGQQFIADNRADPAGTTAEQFGAHLRAEIAKWGKAVKASGARVD